MSQDDSSLILFLAGRVSKKQGGKKCRTKTRFEFRCLDGRNRLCSRLLEAPCVCSQFSS